MSSLPVTDVPSRAPEFHSLVVAEVASLTDESVALTFEVPESLREAFRYLPGQHVTLRAEIDGQDVRRSYSISANANSGTIRVGIKRIPDGTFSSWATTRLKAGDRLDVMAPVGEFTIDVDPARPRHYCAVAAGSGITPVLSHISTVLESEPGSRFTLVLGNRETRTIMFLEELAGLKDRYPDRFQLVHVLSREPQVVELFHGRIDAGKLESLFDVVVDPEGIDDWYLCGPFGMVQEARRLLDERGVHPDHVHDELFFNEEIPELPEPPSDREGLATVTFTLDGRASTVMVDPDGPSILDHALQVRRELPFACKGGVCATCKAGLVSGQVRMDQNWALVADEVDRGLVLTCQSHPVTDDVVLDYDV